MKTFVIALTLMVAVLGLPGAAEAHQPACANNVPLIERACLLLCPVQHFVTAPPHDCSA